ncbi:unnamed protein product [Angiostrongylus costaricensis]|uniref:RING-type domain-containing protein n=1 Tax=Angiostrongylus costaricensis TaxID=334426 RepID=A0A158PKY1_ANGCS|nr:unnamed protein product [Angiostrongylus costaricensis]
MHAPRHRAKVSYDKGRCVPVGWKPLVVDPRVRSYIYARAKRTCLEARDREAQRRAAEERQRERQQMRERVDEDLEACEAEKWSCMMRKVQLRFGTKSLILLEHVSLERVKARRDELAAEKHECFTKLKACLQRESMQKKAEDEKKRRELITLQMQQPFLAATIQAQAQVQAQAQANSLISNQHLLTQQNLLSQHFNAHSLLNQQALLQHQQLLAAQKLQELAQQRSLVQQQQQQQQQSTPQATAQQSLPAGISPAYLQQALGQVQGLLPGPSPTVPGFTANTAVNMSLSTLDDVCPICLCSMDEEFSRPENCQHRFDLECLTEWSKLRLSCPSCRSTFGAVYSYKIVGAKPVLFKVQKMDPPKEAEPFDETNPLDFTMCEICSGGQNEELLLICDQCDKGDYSDEGSTEGEYYEQDEEEEADNESVSSHEEEINDFFDDDARVLGDLELSVSYGVPSLPSVKRSKKRRCMKKSSKRATKTRKLVQKSAKRKRRRNKPILSTQKCKRPIKVEDTLISSASRRGAPREPITRLSLLGAELEPVVDP